MTTAITASISISPVEDIVADMRAGRMVILIDEEDRENEGDLVLAADHVTAEAVNFMARFGRGRICLERSPDMSTMPPHMRSIRSREMLGNVSNTR